MAARMTPAAQAVYDALKITHTQRTFYSHGDDKPLADHYLPLDDIGLGQRTGLNGKQIRAALKQLAKRGLIAIHEEVKLAAKGAGRG